MINRILKGIYVFVIGFIIVIGITSLFSVRSENETLPIAISLIYLASIIYISNNNST